MVYNADNGPTLSYRSEDTSGNIKLDMEANAAQFEMFAIPVYGRIQIPLRMGEDHGIATIAYWTQFAAELRNLAAELDRLHAESRTGELLRTRRMLNAIRHANKQMVLDSPRKQSKTTSRG